MQWLEIKVTYQAADVTLAADLIADAFYALGAKGVVVDDPVVDPTQDWGDDALPPPDEPAVTGYLPVSDRLNDQRALLADQLAALAAAGHFTHAISVADLDDEDWAESWKAFFHPQKLTDRFVVKPTWREYTAQDGEQIIEIDPGMAFGTGTHPTTTLCIGLLEQYLTPGASVLDVGTGSGILLAAAHMLGAARLHGVDNDPVAVDIARNNLTLNRVPEAMAVLETGDLAATVTGRYHVVVANILADVILRLIPDIGPILTPAGLFICSGIIEAYEEKVKRALDHHGLEWLETRRQGDWVALVARNPQTA